MTNEEIERLLKESKRYLEKEFDAFSKSIEKELKSAKKSALDGL